MHLEIRAVGRGLKRRVGIKNSTGEALHKADGLNVLLRLPRRTRGLDSRQ